VLQCPIIHAYFKCDINRVSPTLRSSRGVLGKILMRVGIEYCTVGVGYRESPSGCLSVGIVTGSSVPSEVRCLMDDRSGLVVG